MLKNIITFTVLLLIVSAIGLLFFPAKMLTVVGIAGNNQLNFLLRVSGVGVAALIPGAWAVRESASASPLSRAVLIGLVIYMVLSSIVDFLAYKQAIVNGTSIPSIALRILLGLIILLLTFKDASKK